MLKLKFSDVALNMYCLITFISVIIAFASNFSFRTSFLLLDFGQLFCVLSAVSLRNIKLYREEIKDDIVSNDAELMLPILFLIGIIFIVFGLLNSFL